MANEGSTADTTTVVSLNYTDFINSLNASNDLHADKLQKLFISNEQEIYQAPLAAGGDLPEGGIYFEYMQQLMGFKNLNELRLINLFVKALPEGFTKLSKLQTLEICLSNNADIDEIIGVLKNMPSLKYLDINGSRLAQKQRVYIREQLTKQGIHVDDYVMLK
ncbi:hypothetical protein ACFFGT_27570 [Mucilaginibacter angelicae]|uniref:Leucine-rich repeat domain-containing protein n=1 Tax=Mucilaginibacter angelicae TaxID=869718 RepID=A0ABV6LEW1_9SPHI